MTVPLGTRISVEIEGVAELVRVFDGVQANIADLRPAWQRIALEVLYPSIVANFLAEGRPPWPPLSEDYARRKERIWGAKPILQASGLLFEALSGPEATPYSITEYEPQEMAVGIRAEPASRSGLFYGVYHQSRSPRRGRLPRRAFMAIQEQDVQPIIKAIHEHIAEPMRQRRQSTVAGAWQRTESW